MSREEAVSLNVGVHNTAMKMGARTLLPPFQGSPVVGGATQGSASLHPGLGFPPPLRG